MRVLVKKMSKLGILKFEMLIGALVMIAAVVVLPVALLINDASLLLNPFIIGTVIVTALIFSALAYFLFIRPYFLYRKMPEVLAESDGEYLYVYGKKQAKIPLSALEGATVSYHLPFIYSKEFFAVLLVYFFSEKYGDLIIDVPEYGSYELPFVANVMDASKDLLSYLRSATISNDR